VNELFESKWFPRSMGWAAVALAFWVGLTWSGGLGYITLAGTGFIIWNVVNISANLGAIKAYRKMKTRI